MGLLIFLAVGALVIAGPLVWVAWRSSLRTGATNMVLLGAAAGRAEANLWHAALGGAGIQAVIHNVGDFLPTEGGTNPYAYEVWVPARDEQRAREVLGL